jgi:hypothetical protein
VIEAEGLLWSLLADDHAAVAEAALHALLRLAQKPALEFTAGSRTLLLPLADQAETQWTVVRPRALPEPAPLSLWSHDGALWVGQRAATMVS